MSAADSRSAAADRVDEDIDAIAAAVLACPSVAELSGGGLSQVATYLPGRRVLGIRSENDRLTVVVVAALGSSVPTLNQQVRAAVAPFAAGRPVDIRVTDVQVPADLESDDEAQPALPAG